MWAHVFSEFIMRAAVADTYWCKTPMLLDTGAFCLSGLFDTVGSLPWSVVNWVLV